MASSEKGRRERKRERNKGLELDSCEADKECKEGEVVMGLRRGRWESFFVT